MWKTLWIMWITICKVEKNKYYVNHLKRVERAARKQKKRRKRAVFPW